MVKRRKKWKIHENRNNKNSLNEPITEWIKKKRVSNAKNAALLINS